ncbi:hypothetical protein [Streptacidiphilus sp. MAP5-3]|uniref:hypothetical protein n=1 Tax=unclassified Streptacidiphilus TaxID=2643834 RepID=UPI0035182EBA
MRRIPPRPTRRRAAALAAATAAATAFALAPAVALAPTAWASGVNGADITLSPDTVDPGDTVGLIVNCSSSYFGTPNPTMVSSLAFVTAVKLHPMPGQAGFFSGAATVSHDVKPGDYNVSGACQVTNTSLSGFNATVTVKGHEHEHPHGPVHTGVGGSVDPGNGTQVAFGLGIAGLGGGALYWSRRRGGQH